MTARCKRDKLTATDGIGHRVGLTARWQAGLPHDPPRRNIHRAQIVVRRSCLEYQVAARHHVAADVEDAGLERQIVVLTERTGVACGAKCVLPDDLARRKVDGGLCAP